MVADPSTRVITVAAVWPVAQLAKPNQRITRGFQGFNERTVRKTNIWVVATPSHSRKSVVASKAICTLPAT